MRNVILAAALFVCVPGFAQTALPPQWGTSSNAAPTAKGAPGETKKPGKLKPGKGTVTPPGQQTPPAAQPAQPAAPANTGPAQPASAPVAPIPVPVPIPIPVRAVAPPPAPVPTPSPPVAAAGAPAKNASVEPGKATTAKQKPVARTKKPTNADLLTPAKPRAATVPAVASTSPALVAPTLPAAATASPSVTKAVPAPSVATVATPAPTYVAPAYVPPPVTNYSPPAAVPPTATASAPPARTYTVPPVATAPIPTNAAGEPLPGAYVPPLPPAAGAPTPLPSLVASSPRNRRKAAARDAALAASLGGPGLIDISAALSIGVTPTYPGTAPLAMRFDYDLERGAPLDLSEFSMSNHTGTHVDAPLHFLRGAPAIDQIPLEQLCGPVLVLNIDPSVAVITAADLERYPWRGARRILFRTRNSVNEWIVDPQFHPDYVWLAPDAAELLVSGGVELVGIDYLSIEQYGAPPRTHVILLSKGIAIVEGLDLRQVSAGEYDLTLLPLKILGHEAAPARAVLRRR